MGIYFVLGTTNPDRECLNPVEDEMLQWGSVLKAPIFSFFLISWNICVGPQAPIQSPHPSLSAPFPLEIPLFFWNPPFSHLTACIEVSRMDILIMSGYTKNPPKPS